MRLIATASFVLIAVIGMGASWHHGATSNNHLTPDPVMLPAASNLLWQSVPSTGRYANACYRAKVPGGWLVTLNQERGTHGAGVGLTFVPDPEHAWR